MAKVAGRVKISGRSDLTTDDRWLRVVGSLIYESIKTNTNLSSRRDYSSLKENRYPSRII